MIDLSMLRMLKHRDLFQTMHSRIPNANLDATTRIILRDFKRYFKELPDHTVVNMTTFTSMFFTWNPKLSADHKKQYTRIFKQVQQDVPVSDHTAVMRGLLELNLGSKLATLLNQFEEGDVDNIHGEISKMMDEFAQEAKIPVLDFDRTPISTLLENDANDAGLRWRLDCINKSMRGLRAGDFGILAGRPDKGKTTFAASEVTFMAAQLPEGVPVVWINNESTAAKTRTRLYQAALGVRKSTMIEMHQQGVLERKYLDAMGGMDWRIRVFDAHGLDTYAVERIFDKHGPGLVVYDMIDNIRGFGDSARNDLALERMYQWARELCVTYECVGLATSQISNEGDGLQFPTMPMLKDSKTGKQGACDFQLMIGASNDIALANVRFIGLPKNKLVRDDGPSDPRAEVDYLPKLGRYHDLPETIHEEKSDTGSEKTASGKSGNDSPSSSKGTGGSNTVTDEVDLEDLFKS